MLRNLFILLFALTAISICQSQPQLQDGFNIEWYTRDWIAPIDLDFDENGVMYVSEKEGTVWVVKDGVKSQEPFLDISDEVANFGDMGLLSIALDNDFLTNGFVYLYYAVDRNHWANRHSPSYDPQNDEYWNATFARVTRYQTSEKLNFSKVDPDSRKILLGKNQLDGVPSLYTSHMGGTVLMGDDGTLLISTGDGSTWRAPYGGNGPPYFEEYVEQGLRDQIIKPEEDLGAFRSQYIQNLNGKVLRIDAETGAGLSSNPYFQEANPFGAASRVYALGLRNGYRMSLRKGSGSKDPDLGLPGVLYITDVGNQNWEELNVAKVPGQNFGWPVYEGVQPMVDFYNMETVHPNYKSAAGGCREAGYLFKDLIQQPKLEFPFNVFTDPCDENEELEEGYTHVHSLPAMSFGHWSVGGSFYVPEYDEEGEPTQLKVDDPRSSAYGDSNGWHGICGIVGGVYQGDAFPEWYKGKLFIGDYDRGWIKTVETDLNDDIIGINHFYTDTMKISHIEINPHDGALYFIDFKNGIRKISYGQNIKPVAILKADKNYGGSPLTVSFDASESYDPNDDEITIRWMLNDEEVSSERTIEYTFESNGNIPVSRWMLLEVSDEEGLIATDSILISLNNTPPIVNITAINEGDTYPVDGLTLLDLEADVSDKEHNTEELLYEWQLFLGHNTHEHPEAIMIEQSPTIQILPTSCGAEQFYYRIELTVTDPEGLKSTDSKILTPDCDGAFVELLVFSVDQLNDGLSVNWTTGFEKRLDKIYIERTDKNNGEFLVVEEVDATNQGKSRWNYNFIDDNLSNGNRIYRLRLVSDDGREVYSQNVEVVFIHPETMEVYPNPAQSYVTVLFGQLVGEGYIMIYDAQGKLVAKDLFSSDGPLLNRVNIGHLYPGNYFYSINNGGSSEHGKLIVVN